MAGDQELINFLNWAATPEGQDWGRMLTLGEPAGNPGYSFAAANYNRDTNKYEGGGVTWMGQEGGDTPEARKAFEQYLANSSIVNPSKINYTSPTGMMGGSVSTQPVGQPVAGPAAVANPTSTAPNPFAGMSQSDLEGLRTYAGWAQGLKPSGGMLSPDQAIVRFGQEPPATVEERDWLANEFYAAVRNNPDVLKQLTPEQQMQYAWLQYEKGLISGNQKDDRIKEIRRTSGMPSEDFLNEDDKKDTRVIARNKISDAGKKDGLTSGDVFEIGAYTQRDTGKDYGTLAQLNNKIAPGFNINDVANSKAVQVAGLLAAPFTGGVSASVTQGLQAVDKGELGLKEALGIFGPLLTPQVPTGSSGSGALNLIDDTVNLPTSGSGIIDKITGVDWQGVRDVFNDKPRASVDDIEWRGDKPPTQRQLEAFILRSLGEPGDPNDWRWVKVDGKWTAQRAGTEGGGGGGGAPTSGGAGSGAPSTSTNPLGGEKLPTDPGQGGGESTDPTDGIDWGALLGGFGGFGDWDSVFDDGPSGPGGSLGGGLSVGGGGTPGTGPGSGGGTGEGPGPGDGPGDGESEGEGPETGPASIAAGMLAAGSKEDWKDFNSGINVKFPLLQKLGITPTQYLQLLMARAQ